MERIDEDNIITFKKWIYRSILINCFYAHHMNLCIAPERWRPPPIQIRPQVPTPRTDPWPVMNSSSNRQILPPSAGKIVNEKPCRQVNRSGFDTRHMT